MLSSSLKTSSKPPQNLNIVFIQLTARVAAPPPHLLSRWPRPRRCAGPAPPCRSARARAPRAHRAPHLEERRLRVHGAIALSVAEVEHAGEAGAIRPHVGAHAVAVVAVELPAVGLRAESAGSGVPPEKLPLTLGA